MQYAVIKFALVSSKTNNNIQQFYKNINAGIVKNYQMIIYQLQNKKQGGKK